MPRIKLLAESLRNKIAAGEVVERPASVVKELIENSLDAGSTTIDIEISRGGRKLIRVADNGTGMDKEDALLCLERHATSKLDSEKDLFNISTLGFRGEALPSIASVSRLSLTTAVRGNSAGVSVEVEGGRVTGVKDSPSEGTDIAVKDLFFNTPARRKFLKRDSTELLHIVDAVTRSSLANPHVGYTLRMDGQDTMVLPRSSGLRERLTQVYGHEFVDGLVAFEKESEDVKVTAFVSRLGNLRDTRTHQFIFINGRPVKDPSIAHAVYSAYEGLAPPDKFPIFFIFLEMEPTLVDFNVHPAKREVRFQDKEIVYRFVKGSVHGALVGEQKGKAEDAAEGPSRVVGMDRPRGTAYVAPETAEHIRVSESVALDYEVDVPYIYLGETFVAIAERDGLTILDHHAAHERVLYEKFLNGMRLNSRQLLFPRQVQLSPREHMLVLKHRDVLLEFGIDIEDFGQNSVAVRSLPEEMEEADLRGVLYDAAEEMRAGKKPGRSLKEALAARIACHGSVRGRVILNREELSSLLRDLDEAKDPDHCPHGRPTRVHYSADELKKLFKRK